MKTYLAILCLWIVSSTQSQVSAQSKPAVPSKASAPSTPSAPSKSSSSPQSSAGPATVNCLTDWHVGNSHSYTITHEQSQQFPGAPIQKSQNTWTVYITVIDQTETDYTVKWLYHIPEPLRVGRPGLKDSLPIIEGMQVIFKISDVGIFQELVNWEEVREDIIRLTVLSTPEAKDSIAAGAALEALRKKYATREAVEAAMIREVQLFHTPYGYEYPTRAVSEATTLVSPFVNGKPLPAIQTMQATSIENNSYALLITQSVDKTKAQPFIPGNAADFMLEDSTRYRFKSPSGWLDKLSFKRTAGMKGAIQTDEYTMVQEF